MPTEPPQRLERRKFLVELEAKIDAFQEDEIPTSQLGQWNIHLQRMALDGESDLKPRFFVPYPKLPEPEDDLITHLQSTLDCEDFCFTRPVDRARQIEHDLRKYTAHWTYEPSWTSIWTFKAVADFTAWPKSLHKYDQPEFGVFRIKDIPGGDFPHTMAVMYSNLDGHDHTLLRGELRNILRIMLGQLRKVLLFSLMGKRGRAIEAYFDGQQFVLRCSELYHFREQTTKAFRDFAEWYLGDPVGDTRS